MASRLAIAIPAEIAEDLHAAFHYVMVFHAPEHTRQELAGRSEEPLGQPYLKVITKITTGRSEEPLGQPYLKVFTEITKRKKTTKQIPRPVPLCVMVFATQRNARTPVGTLATLTDDTHTTISIDLNITH